MVLSSCGSKGANTLNGLYRHLTCGKAQTAGQTVASPCLVLESRNLIAVQ